jgi:ligand-binding sensor domain-containing protein/two-component sensor histidine kinase
MHFREIFRRLVPAVILILITVSPFLLSSQPYLFSNITTAHGLSSNKVHKVLQDSRGFYWIATANGLNRFDGTTFKIFRNNRQDSTSLADNFCNDLIEDAESNIWVSTYKGISIYLRRENQFKNLYFHIDDVDDEKLNRFFWMAKDRHGKIWMASVVLSSYDPQNGRFEVFRVPGHSGKMLNTLSYYPLYDSINYGIWFCWENQLLFFNAAIQKFYHKNNNPLNWKIFSAIQNAHIALGTENRLWFCDDARARVYCFDIGRNEITESGFTYPRIAAVRFLKADQRNRLWLSFWNHQALIFDYKNQRLDTSFFSLHHRHAALHESFTDIFIDNQKNHWISSYNGISVHRPRKSFFDLYEPGITERGYDNQVFHILSIAPASAQQVWLGTNLGLYHYDLVHRKAEKIEVALPSEPIKALCMQGDSVLWAGTTSAVFKWDIKRKKVLLSFPVKHPIAIRFDAAGNLWVATWSSGIHKLDGHANLLALYRQQNNGKHSIPFNGVISLNSDKEGIMAGLNSDNGLAVYDDNTDAFLRADLHAGKNGNRHGFSVNAILRDDDGKIWMGTYGNGLFVQDEKTKSMHHYLMDDGLSSHFINGIQKDKDNNIWVATSNGVDFFNRVNQRFIPVQPEFVFPFDDYVPSSAAGMDDDLFFFCMNRFIRVFPGQYEKSAEPGKVLLSGLRIFEKVMPLPEPDKTLHLSHKENFFSIEYSLLRCNPAEKVHYSYMLEGFDKDWNDAGHRSFASYTNVPGGKYIFRVRAANEKGEWMDTGTALSIFISKPFWKQVWFFALLFVLIASSAFFVYRYRIGQLRRMYAMRTKISQDLHDDVASTLSGVKLYSELAKQQSLQNQRGQLIESLDVISSNASAMKAELNDIVWAVNPANDTLKKLLDKLNLYARELTRAAGMQFRLSAEDILPEEKLNMQHRRNIYLVCKEAINNAVKYSEASVVELNVFLENKRLNFVICDNGRGMSTNVDHEGNGLMNMKMRADEIGADIRIESSPGSGTAVRLRMKI